MIGSLGLSVTQRPVRSDRPMHNAIHEEVKSRDSMRGILDDMPDVNLEGKENGKRASAESSSLKSSDGSLEHQPKPATSSGMEYLSGYHLFNICRSLTNHQVG